MRSTAQWYFLFFLLAFAFAGTRALWEPDEGRYAEAAREMVASGDWLVPRLQGEAHLTKPPFTYWMTAASLSVFGINEWGARLPLAAAFFGTILCVVALARAWGWRESEARASGLVFATAGLPFACGHILSTDMFLTFWETLGVLAAWRVWAGGAGEERWRAVFWAAFGFAFLTKGPPGWLPLGVIVVFCWTGRTGRTGLTGLTVTTDALTQTEMERAGLTNAGETPAFPGQRPAHERAGRLWSWAGLAIFAIVSFGWYGLLAMREPALVRYFLVEEVYQRVFTGAHGRESSWLMYFYVVPLGLTPWLFVWPGLAGRVWRKLGIGDPSAGGATWPRVRRAVAALNGPEWFSMLWIAIPLLVFCLAKSRMILYVVPLFAPIALWAGRVLVRDEAYRRWFARHRRWTWAIAIGWGVVVVTVAAFPSALRSGRDYRVVARDLAALEPAGEDRTLIVHCLEEPVPQTIAFYCGAKLELEDASLRIVLAKLEIEALLKGRALLLIKRSKLGDLEAYPETRWKLVTQNRRHAVIEIFPTRTPAPAPERRV
jgi:4-amino-4-deoxy-L-arabinose transferase-like glycosyltransferase